MTQICLTVTEGKKKKKGWWIFSINITKKKLCHDKKASPSEHISMWCSQIGGQNKARHSRPAHLVELESSSVSLLQEKAGFGAALGRHSITTRPFLAARTLFTGLCSNVGAQAVEGECGLFITNCTHAYIDDTFYIHKKCLVFWSDIFWVLVQVWPFLKTLFQLCEKKFFSPTKSDIACPNDLQWVSSKRDL